MAWIESIEELPTEPFDLGFIPRSEKKFQDWLHFYGNWEIVFPFKYWTREFHFSSKCKVDFVGCDEAWECGFLVELKIGECKKKHMKQVQRYLGKILNSKSWTKQVSWHGLLLCCEDGKIHVHYVGSKPCRT